MTEQIPLYVGIPLAILCIAVSAVGVVFIVAIWKGKA
jgi:hypothetical protein